MLVRTTISIALLAFALPGSAFAEPPSQLAWQPWSDSVFRQARSERKFVLLDLQAVWCHWCHVMDDITYRDPAVVKLLNQRYLLIKVDQDSRPDISNRYQDFGWPATVVFAADGSEIVKRQGYIPPRPMASMLQAIIDDPSPGPSVQKEAVFHAATTSALTPATLTRVKAGYERQYDKDAAGWGFDHKYLDGDSVEYALRLAARNNADYVKRVADTLHAATALLDPVWGGMYQYSVGGEWKEPHYEKLLSVQATALRQYSLAYAQTQDGAYQQAARSVYDYTTKFLMAPGADVFFVSQDADSLHPDLANGQEDDAYFRLNDHDRREKGMPRIDKHVYARENGWMIAALCDYYAATGDTAALLKAQHAVAWITMHRAIAGGGFRHDDVDAAGPYLADTLSMGQGLLALYNVTGDRKHLTAASAAAQYIEANFQPLTRGTGFVTARVPAGAIHKSRSDRDENIALVRFTSLLAFATSKDRYRAITEDAMRYLAADAVALRPMSAGILLASEDAGVAPLHVTILGSPLNPETSSLRTAALRSIASHEVFEMRDPADASPLQTRITYPNLKRPALFICSATACSSPVYNQGDVRTRIRRAQLQQAE